MKTNLISVSDQHPLESSYSISYFDTGCNALYFDNLAMELCQVNSDFYCPQDTRIFKAELSAGRTKSDTIFVAEHPSRMNLAHHFALPALTGPGGADTFYWGLPFYFGKTFYQVFANAEATEPNGSVIAGPFYAY